MYSHIEISKEILNHNAIEMNIQNLFIFLFILYWILGFVENMHFDRFSQSFLEA